MDYLKDYLLQVLRYLLDLRVWACSIAIAVFIVFCMSLLVFFENLIWVSLDQLVQLLP